MFVRTDFVLLWICVACLASLQGAPVKTQGPQLFIDIIDQAAVSRMSSQELEGLAEAQVAGEIKRYEDHEIYITGEALTSVVSKASAEIQNKDRLVAQASAFIHPASSKTSEHNEEGHEYNDPQHENWNIKESVMYTLFRAANAITGGVTILKGELVRGSGALAITLGKVISVEEDAVGNPVNKPYTTAVYEAPRTSHLQYKRLRTYGASPIPSVSTSYAVYRYPSQLDGNKIIDFHAGLFLAPSKSPDYEYNDHTPLELPFRTVNWWK